MVREEVCLLLWLTENGSCLMATARSTRAPSTALVVKCSSLGRHFQVQIVCGGQSSRVQDTSAVCWWTNTGCCSDLACLSPCWTNSFFFFYHYSNPATCVPFYDPMFPLFSPLPAPRTPLLPFWLLVSSGGGSPCVRPVHQSPHCRPVPVQTTVTDVGDPVFLYKCILTVTLWMM